MIVDYTHFSLVFCKNIVCFFTVILICQKPRKRSLLYFTKANFQQFESGMVGFIAKESCDRVMLISGEQFGCMPLVWCDTFVVVPCMLNWKAVSPFPHQNILPPILLPNEIQAFKDVHWGGWLAQSVKDIPDTLKFIYI